jgi:Cu-Zn family superoxide dismutase
MIRNRTAALVAAVTIGLAPHAAFAASAEVDARAELYDADQRIVGEALLHDTPHGTLIRARFLDLPPGTHAFHIHAVGECEPPFTSAGGHYNPDGKAHGIMSPEGLHAGDMPNIHVPASGKLEIEVLNTRVHVDDLLERDEGTALVIHEGADDYATDPAGAAGPRIACGVIRSE